MNTQVDGGPLVLTFGSTQKVEVIAEDEHRFYTTVSEAARACKVAIEVTLWQLQFKEMLAYLHKWAGDRSDRVRNCYVTWGEGGLRVFVVTHQDKYQFSFDDEISTLDIWLSRTYQDCPATVLQLPNMPTIDLLSFLAPEKAIQVYGESAAA
jgi:L-alanine-DL-glutamate epimerase-like enolase superfamily enzyme